VETADMVDGATLFWTHPMTRTIQLNIDGEPLDFEVEASWDGDCWELENVTLDGEPALDWLTDDEQDQLIEKLNRMDDSNEWTDDYDYVDEYAEANHSFWSKL
jgi:hypothetical protein